jgi:hypothetical protein
MKGIAKVIGASSNFSDLINKEEECFLVYTQPNLHYFTFGETDLRIEIKQIRFGENFIELEGWVADESDLGRFVIHFWPNKCN